MVDSLPLITAIIPTYRRPVLLRRAIQSVLNQTYPNFQVCIYDNASGDETANVVAEFAQKDPRVKYFCHPTNIGAIQNFIQSLSKVETPYFSFFSDDDILLPTFYELAIQSFEKCSEAAVFIGSTIMTNSKGSVVSVPLDSWNQEGLILPPDSFLKMQGNHLLWTGMLFQRSFVEKIKGFKSNCCSFATDLVFRLALRFPVFISKRPCAVFLLNESGVSSSLSIDEIFSSWLQTIENIKNETSVKEEFRDKLIKLAESDLHKTLFALGKEAALNKDFQKAEKALNFLSSVRKSNKKIEGKILFLKIFIKIRKKAGFLWKIAFFYYKHKRIKNDLLCSDLNEKYSKYTGMVFSERDQCEKTTP